MRVWIRVDASVEIGSGHVMRCLTLAGELRKSGCQVQFICREHVGHMRKLINKCGYNAVMLPGSVSTPGEADVADKKMKHLGVSREFDAEVTAKVLANEPADWVIVDHYSLDWKWHRYIKSYCNNLMVIDDLGDRDYECDLLLDQTYARTESIYKDLVSPGCKILTGSDNALLRSQFYNHRKEAQIRRKQQAAVKRILVSMGGMDPDDVTSIVLEGLFKVDWRGTVDVDVVLGEYAPHLGKIETLRTNSNIRLNVITSADDMSGLMLKADLAIGSGGTSSWERCCLGLPTLMVISADNQLDIVNNLSSEGIVKNLGWYYLLEPERLKESIENLLGNPTELVAMSEKSFAVCDGLGVQRVVSALS